MAARVCGVCRLRLPNRTDMNPCPVCGAETGYDQLADPDPEIEVEVRAALHVSASRRGLLMHRRRRFVRLGFSGAMLDMLAESSVDLHEAEDLVGRGCPLDLVPRIL